MYEKNDILFKYELKDAFGKSIKSVIVTNNSIYLYYDSKEKKSIFNTKNLVSILNKYSTEFDNIKDQKAPFLAILDGFINEIDFKANDKWYNFNINNLGYYQEEDINNNEFLKNIFSLLDDVYDELKKQNIEIEDYFVLIEDEENEE